jgi:putative PIN family toxin of toxin-antitoxin system
MIKAVIDTNVFISAILWKGTPQKVLEKWSQGKFKLIVSNEIVLEYEEILNRLLNHSQQITHRAIETVRLHAEYVQPISLPKPICRDPDDDIFIGTALSAKADYIVSGDKDLLSLKEIMNTKIVTPREFNEAI